MSWYELESIKPEFRFCWINFSPFLTKSFHVSIYLNDRLCEIWTLVNFNLGLGVDSGAKSFIFCEFDTLGTFFRALSPLKHCYFGAFGEVPDIEIFLSLNKFLASYQI